MAPIAGCRLGSSICRYHNRIGPPFVRGSFNLAASSAHNIDTSDSREEMTPTLETARIDPGRKMNPDWERVTG
ncbi:MAG: hypothetical protein ACU843_13130 [Gammaproteobacteria bacterium]